jgi:hypothetical protein
MFGTYVWVDGTEVHSNPRFFKHRWRIWTESESMSLEDYWRAEGTGELPQPPELSFYHAIERMRDLCGEGRSFLVTNWKAKRDDPMAPWDIGAVRANGGRVAPSYDDDQDPPVWGHK